MVQSISAAMKGIGIWRSTLGSVQKLHIPHTPVKTLTHLLFQVLWHVPRFSFDPQHRMKAGSPVQTPSYSCAIIIPGYQNNARQHLRLLNRYKADQSLICLSQKHGKMGEKLCCCAMPMWDPDRCKEMESKFMPEPSPPFIGLYSHKIIWIGRNPQKSSNTLLLQWTGAPIARHQRSACQALEWLRICLVKKLENK